MPVQSQKVFVIKQPVDGEWQLLKPLLFPEYCRLSAEGELPLQCKERLCEQVAAIRNALRYRSIVPEEPVVDQVIVQVPPPQSLIKSKQWQSPVAVQFHYVSWSHPSAATTVFVPALGIEIIHSAKHDHSIQELVQAEIVSCLRRDRRLASLKNLLEFERYEAPEVIAIDAEFDLLSPKEEALAQRGKKDEFKTLKEVGDRIRPTQRPSGHLLDEPIRKLADILFASIRQSALLVGPTGVGKTSVIVGLAREKNRFQQGTVEFWETAGSRIVAGMSGFGQWQERCQDLVEELSKKNAVLHLGNLFELLHVGKSISQNQGIASFLRPYIERGNIRVTAEVLPSQIALIEKEDPQLLQAFQRLEIKAPEEKRVKEILTAEADTRRTSADLKIDESAIKTVYELHRRYAAYSAMPGRPIQFLRKLIDDAENSASLTSESVISQFSKETGLPFFLLSQEIPLKVDDTTHWFAQRVIGQPTPVDLVVNMLASVKANLTPQGKPIASFLFIGPTGVGKTEMAKSITKFMFGDEQKMIRFDMSEFTNLASIDRLIGGNAEEEGQLTSRVRQSPFSLLLFDEFEKAHASFFDLLLQILGEGRLTDSRGRTTDFSTTIIVMTSNLGAESMKDQPLGFADSSLTADRSHTHFTREVQNFVRPELYNRIDRIVPFAPLDFDTVKSVTRREIEKLKRREGVWFRPLQLDVDPAAVDFIAKHGQDPRYGARPIQRFIQDHLVVPVASKLNRHPANLKIEAQVTASEGELVVETAVVQPARPKKGLATVDAEHLGITDYDGIRMVRQQRRRAQSLSHSNLADRIRNEQFRHQQQLNRLRKVYQRKVRSRSTDDEAASLNWQLHEKEREIARYAKVIGAIEAVVERAAKLEQSALANYFSDQEINCTELREVAFELKREINRALFDLFVFDSPNHEKVTVVVYGKHFSMLNLLLAGYQAAADARGYQVRRFVLRKYRPEQRNKANYSLTRALTGAEKLESDGGSSGSKQASKRGAATGQNGDQDSQSKEHLLAANVFACDSLDQVNEQDLIGIALELHGAAAFPLFISEAGIHRFKNPGSDPVFVEVFGHSLFNHDLPSEFATGAKFERDQKCREYELNEKKVSDRILGNRQYESLTAEIQATLEAALQFHLDKVIGSWN